MRELSEDEITLLVEFFQILDRWDRESQSSAEDAVLSTCPSALGSHGEADLPRTAAGLAERSGRHSSK